MGQQQRSLLVYILRFSCVCLFGCNHVIALPNCRAPYSAFDMSPTLKKEYEAKKAGASLTLEENKTNYVLQQLHAFDEKVDSQCNCYVCRVLYLLSLYIYILSSHPRSHILTHLAHLMVCWFACRFGLKKRRKHGVGQPSIVSSSISQWHQVHNAHGTTLSTSILYAHDVCFVVGYDFNSLCVGKCFCQIDTFLEILGCACCILWLILFVDYPNTTSYILPVIWHTLSA